MRARGSCLCGAIAYAVTETVDNMSHCFCSMCRKTHGAMFGTYVSVPASGFDWERGEELRRMYESSPGFARAFCPICGSVLPSGNTAGEFAVPVGALEEDCGVRPRSNIFVTAKAPWHQITNDLPSYESYYPGTGRPTIEVESRENDQEGAVGGSCQCGSVKFEYQGTPHFMWHCHCSLCRKAKGAAHATNVFVERDNFRWVCGADEILVYRLPEARRFGNAFCRYCGSSVARAMSQPALMIIPAGSLDDPPGIEASAHAHVASMAPWFEVTDDMPRFDGILPGWG